MTQTKHILVIDDDTALSSALESKFISKGYMVTVAKDGTDGMEKLNAQVFDVIMTDLHMPNLNGFDVLEKLSDTKNADTPVYVITNLGSDVHCEKAISLGAKQCFVKSLVTLRDVVRLVDQECAKTVTHQ